MANSKGSSSNASGIINDDPCSCSSSSVDGSVPATGNSSHVIDDLTREREERVVMWLQALNVQVIGACRADERLNPMLISNSMGGLAEDRLLSHLNQHFEPAEVGMLARCFCIPLVSLRVGMIEKQGTLFTPTSVRGYLNVMVLPTSDMRLIYFGDNGTTERLVTMGTKSDCLGVSIEQISADNSGRSFRIKISDGRDFFYWCAEKSKLLATELFHKMKDILERKPSISDISGIDELRLDCFATHLNTYLVGNNESPCTSNRSSSQKPTKTRHAGTQPNKSQVSLSPKSSPFKEAQTRNVREKLKRRSDGLLDTLMNLQPQDNEKPVQQVTITEVSPSYCWCPLGDGMPTSFTDTLSAALTPFDLPALLAEPVVVGSQQMPALAPLMCEPIVHIPVMKGQGYMVSAAPALTPLMTSEAESVLEKGARETLRLLLSSAGHSKSLTVNVLGPCVFSLSGSVGESGGSEHVGLHDDDDNANGNPNLSEDLIQPNDVSQNVNKSG